MMYNTIVIAISVPFYYFISVTGIIGNLVTILALYYAKRKRRYGFHENWCTSTIYVINLAFIDFMFCVTMLIQVSTPLYYMSYEDDHIIFNDTDVWGCTLVTHMQILFGSLDGSAIACISVMRAIAVTSNQKWETLCERKRNVFIFLLSPWFFTLVIYAPTFGQLFKRNRETGYCLPVMEDSTSWYVENVRYVIHGIVGTTIILSYFYILCYVSRHSRASKDSHFILTREDSKLVNSRNIQIAKTMAIVAFSSIFLFLPWLLVQILHNLNRIDEDAYILCSMITYAILSLQYCINMFIYVWKKDGYRQAILDGFTICNTNKYAKKRNPTTLSKNTSHLKNTT